MLSIKYQVLKELCSMLPSELVENVGVITDLKLYDLFYDSDIDFSDAMFDNFCYCEFNFFNGYLVENCCKCDYIGRTSKFTVNSSYRDFLYSYYNQCDYFANNKLTTLGKKVMIITEWLYYNDSICIASENKLSVSDAEILDAYDNCTYKETIEYIKHDFKDCIECLRDIKNVYDYINDFKKNQIENFKAFLDAC